MHDDIYLQNVALYLCWSMFDKSGWRVACNFMFPHEAMMKYIYIIIVSCLFAQNIAGTYRCACPEGFIQHFYRSECVDDNECNQSPCGSGTCYNTYGSYRCGCPDGYQFDTALSVCIQVKIISLHDWKIVIFKLSVLCSQMCCMYITGNVNILKN